jgi:MFS family permease
MSSITPLAGRLSQIFTPRLYVVFSTTLLAIGLFVSAAAPSLAVFLLGRAVAGCGSGGLMSTSIILVLDMVSKKRRGLCIGLINCGYTTGVASGAVFAGLLAPTLGWVRQKAATSVWSKNADRQFQRVIFWVQAPIALVIGPLLFFAIPKPSGDNANPLHMEHLLPNLARVDYIGAMTLVWQLFSSSLSQQLTFSRQSRSCFS